MGCPGNPFISSLGIRCFLFNSYPECTSFLFSYLKTFFIVVQVQLSLFFPLHSPIHPQPLPSILPTLALSMSPLCMFLDDPSPIFPIIPLPTPPVTNSVFFNSKSLFIFCLLVCFVDQVPIKGKITWYLSFTTWLISFSIMLSRSIHAVAKGRRSFFLSAAQYSIV